MAYVRDYVELTDRYRTPEGWRYATSSHLLLERGRLFTPAMRPAGIGKLPDRYCYINAAQTARAHQLLYAEGMAAFLSRGALVCLPHAWCVDPGGVVVDPTWEPAGAAYLGIVIADADLWPADNRGLLEDFHRSQPALERRLPEESHPGLGRPVTPALLSRRADR